MFETDLVSTIAARRAGRFAFGLTLVIGSVGLVANVVHDSPLPSADLIPAIWIAAAVARIAVYSAMPPVSRERADELANAGLVLPSIGIALMLPLTIHLPFFLATGTASDFEGWVKLSAIITGPTHIALATLVAVRAGHLVVGKIPMSVMAIYGICVGVSCIPFAIFVIPPFVVALTGLACIPLMMYQARIAEEERAEMPSFVPCATARRRLAVA